MSFWTPLRLGLLAGGGEPPIIDPSTLPNLAAWFRKGVGITEAGGLVSQWADQSGNDRHLTQSTDTNKPALQGDGSILFDGVDNHMATTGFTFAQPKTVYILGKQITWTTNDCWCDAANANDRTQISQSGSSGRIRLNAGTTLAFVTLALDTYGIISAVFNGADSVLQLNNDTPVVGNAGTGIGTGLRLGAIGGGGSAFGNVQIKEVLLFAEAHDADTRAEIIRYLASVQEADDPDFFI